MTRRVIKCVLLLLDQESLILTNWKHGLILTIDTRAIAKVSLLILLQLQGRY